MYTHTRSRLLRVSADNRNISNCQYGNSSDDSCTLCELLLFYYQLSLLCTSTVLKLFVRNFLANSPVKAERSKHQTPGVSVNLTVSTLKTRHGLTYNFLYPFGSEKKKGIDLIYD